MSAVGPSSVEPPLDGWLVADLSTGIAGAYATKILADGGAEVVKLEPPEGDRLRAWSASGATIADGDDGALFRFLAASKRSVVADPTTDLDRVHDWLGAADVVVWSPGSALADLDELAPDRIRRDHPHLTVTTITPFGLDGPWRDRAATEFTLQAWCGGHIGLGRGDPERAPVFVGGQIGEWLAGAFAAVGTLAAQRRGRLDRTGDGAGGDLVDVSMLEALALCLTYYPVTFFDALGKPFRGRRQVTTPGVGLASDGLVAVGVGTGQHWLDFCAMVGHPEWMDDPSLFRQRSHLAPEIDQWFAAHTVAEIRELASAFRLPNALIANGQNLPGLDHFVARGSFSASPDATFVQPGPPYRLHPARLRAPESAPRLGQHTPAAPPPRRVPADPSGSSDDLPCGDQPSGDLPSGDLPYGDLRVLDLTAFWAGPSCTHLLAMLGAEVIHVESTGRLDGTRMLGAPMSVEQWWERSPIFAGLNTDKKSLTLDLGSARGQEVLRQLVATADVIVENYTPRVLEQLGLTFEGAQAIKPDIIVVRMPGFGLDGPWRDHAAFAYTIEDAGGLTWMTGHPDQPPLEPYCVGDPNAGVHAFAGLALALAHRDRTGQGGLVEAAMIDAALNVSAEQVIEYSAYGALLARAGNRGPTAAPQNLYRTVDVDERGGHDSWVAIAVASDAQWAALVDVLGRPDWAVVPELSSASGRVAHQDRIDEHLAAWCAPRLGAEVVDAVWPAGVAVAVVTQPHRQGELDQLVARGFFEVVDHPVMGPTRHATLPMRFSGGPTVVHRHPAPQLGQHNHELLGGLGLTDAEIADLEADGIIGRAPADATTRRP
jgi:crotonobetainyl-CoA:carnitine CoA-transferase CaiB-like acyl-CoA transferase